MSGTRQHGAAARGAAAPCCLAAGARREPLCGRPPGGCDVAGMVGVGGWTRRYSRCSSGPPAAVPSSGDRSRGWARVVEASARCARCDSKYAVQRRVVLLLPSERPQLDRCREGESRPAMLLCERRTSSGLSSDPSDLAPAELFYRALVLEERGDFAVARRVAALTYAGLYTEETRACRDRQLEGLVARPERRRSVCTPRRATLHRLRPRPRHDSVLPQERQRERCGD